MRDELFTTKVLLENRAYFFNVKENRMGDVFLQVVESKSKNGEDFDRRAIVVFADDMQQFCKGLDDSLAFIAKTKKERGKPVKKIVKMKNDSERVAPNGDGFEYKSPVKRTGKVHVVKKKD